MGDELGWRGPCGTTYPVNLRLLMNSLTQDQWVQLARGLQTRTATNLSGQGPWCFRYREKVLSDQSALLQRGHLAPRLVPSAGEA
jgi:hypothetical protein